MYPAAELEMKVVYEEPLFVNEVYFFMTIIVQEAPIEDNTSLKCNSTLAATCGCKF